MFKKQTQPSHDVSADGLFLTSSSLLQVLRHYNIRSADDAPPGTCL